MNVEQQLWPGVNSEDLNIKAISISPIFHTFCVICSLVFKCLSGLSTPNRPTGKTSVEADLIGKIRLGSSSADVPSQELRTLLARLGIPI